LKRQGRSRWVALSSLMLVSVCPFECYFVWKHSTWAQPTGVRLAQHVVRQAAYDSTHPADPAWLARSHQLHSLTITHHTTSFANSQLQPSEGQHSGTRVYPGTANLDRPANLLGAQCRGGQAAQGTHHSPTLRSTTESEYGGWMLVLTPAVASEVRPGCSKQKPATSAQ
jgi:hypothetical protein